MTDTSPTPADRPADQLRAAAEKLRAAAMGSPMNSSPWRYAKGLPSDSVRTEVGWEVVYGDAPGDLRYIALMHPGVGLALAAWLDTEAATWAGDEVHNSCSTQSCTFDAALAVARQLLGTTMLSELTDDLTAEEAREQAHDLATQLYKAQDALAFVGECCDIADREHRTVTTGDVREWLKGARCGRQLLGTSAAEGEPGCAMPGFVGCECDHVTGCQHPAAPPAPADRAAEAKAATTITRLRAERAELNRRLDCLRGDVRDMESCLREQDAEFERIRSAASETASAPLAARVEALAAEWEKRGEYGDSSITDRARELRAVLADLAPACICGHPEQRHFEDVCQTCDCGDYLVPEAAREMIAHLRHAVLAKQDGRRATTLREAADAVDNTEFPDEYVDLFDNGARWASRLLRRLAADAAAGVQPPTTGEAGLSYRLEHRHREEDTWRPNTPGIGANWSWQSREKAAQRLAEARTRWPDFEHRLIETTTTVASRVLPDCLACGHYRCDGDGPCGALLDAWQRCTCTATPPAAPAAPEEQAAPAEAEEAKPRLLWSDLLGADPDITGGACTECYMDRARDRDHDMSPEHAHCRAALDGDDTTAPEEPTR
ncbi:hypothetical protein ACFU67_13335 [Streptomyces rhizosphaericola]|uniref:hypothetical protein n=1 Tax=Streptomyces rhizosphaericola TaxID=2564098 RepID=UPI0036C6D580